MVLAALLHFRLVPPPSLTPFWVPRHPPARRRAPAPVADAPRGFGGFGNVDELIEEFEACLLKGLPNGAPKGTCLVFDTSGGKLGLTVNDKSVATIGSKVLSSAFANIYSDKNAVCAMNPVGEDGAATSGGGFFNAPKVGALAGAYVGYHVGKAFA